ncbi:hypothetical protein J437_LFUL000197 [Ladona fulva]|uniref:Uncharacterized protein n=1 Tax=Ladona fulva TaxID=123851 RepID=A0A8K0KD26_LADFU|nr:hypothetical protein J437_LFUL000197 [Ladona fulva]
MAGGGKGESGPLSEFISELEHFLDATEVEIIILKNTIAQAKRLLSLSSELDVVNEEKEASIVEDIQEKTHLGKNDVESSLEEDINRILKVAQKVRNRAKSDENVKSATKHSVQKSKTIPKKGGQAFAISKATKNKVGQRCVTSTAALDQAKTPITCLKTTLSRDIHIIRGQQSISIRKDSREMAKKPNNHKLDKTSKSSKEPVKLLRPELKESNVSDKRKVLPMQRLINKSPGDKGSSAEPFRISTFLGEVNPKKPSLLEAILKKAEIPKYQELLEGIKCYHSFPRKIRGEFHKERNELKRKFLKKCVALDNTSDGSKSPLNSILKKLLPFGGWAVRIESCPDMNLLNEIMKEEKDNIQKVMSTYHRERINTDDMFSSDSLSDVSNLREYGIWNPGIIFPVSQGLEGLSYLQYENVKEQLSFQNDLHELQEYQLKIKMFQHISHIISHYFIHPENFGNEGKHLCFSKLYMSLFGNGSEK